MKRLLLLAVLLLPACRRENPEHFSGTLELTEHSLGLPASRRLATIRVDEGDAVTRGQLLATTERFEQADRDARRAADLLQNGGGSRQAVEQAELTLRDERIVSPVDGVVLVKVHDAGEVVPAGSAVFVVGDRSRLWVRFYIPEGQINRIRNGQEAEVRVDGIKESFKGRVRYIAPSAEFTPRNVQTPEERVTQTFAVKVDLENPPDYLRPGVAADVDLK